MKDTIEFKDAAFQKVAIEESSDDEDVKAAEQQVKDAVKEAPKEVSPTKLRPQTPKTSADYEKKESQRPKFAKVQEKVEAKKAEAAACFKKGDYIQANKIYKQAATQLEDLLEDFPLFTKEISQVEATIYNNIAFCYGKDQQHRQEIEFTTKVIDRALYLDDTNVLLKAYLRRGLAYEKCEKFKLACNDLQRVKELQPFNQQAQNAMTRCLKFIKQDEGIDYIPKVDDIELPKMDGIKTAEQQLADEKVKIPASPIKTEQKPVVAPTPKVEEPPKPKVDDKEKKLKELYDKLLVFKERGNTHFKKQAYKEAIKHFSEAINLYESQNALSDDNVKLVVTQLLTNRSLAFHHLGQQNSAMSDATYVLTKLDDKNAKALFRRAHAYKTMNKWEEAARDLQVLYKENQEESVKNEISVCLKKAIESKKVT